MYRIFILFAFILIGQCLFASEKDSIIMSKYKNTIRWNPTPMFVVGSKSLVLGYERVLNSSRSFSINIGYLQKAPMTDVEGNPLHIFDQSNKGGFSFSADYRFYFKNRNKFAAPDGLYWAPYTSYYGIWQDATIEIDNGTVKNNLKYNGNFNWYSLGIQLGYQFVINDRFTIDLLLMGPSFSYYDLKLDFEFENTISTDDPFYQELYELLKESNPVLAQALKHQSIDASGRLKFAYYGFRYGFQLGYRF